MGMKNGRKEDWMLDVVWLMVVAKMRSWLYLTFGKDKWNWRKEAQADQLQTTQSKESLVDCDWWPTCPVTATVWVFVRMSAVASHITTPSMHVEAINNRCFLFLFCGLLTSVLHIHHCIWGLAVASLAAHTLCYHAICYSN